MSSLSSSSNIQSVPLDTFSGRQRTLGYAINGIPLPTQPYLATAPTPSGSLITTGTRFTLFFANPDSLTQSLFTNGVVCSLQFLLADGRAPEATVLLVSSWNSPLLLVEVQVLSTTNVSAIQLPFIHLRQDGSTVMTQVFGEIPEDIKDKPLLGLYDPVTHAAVAAQAGTTVVDNTNSVVYAPLASSGGGGGGSATDTFGNATTLTAATTFSGIPTISQLVASSSVLLVNPGDQATFIAAISVPSAFIGTLSFYGLEPDGATLQLINAHQRNSSVNSNSTTISTASALNQVWMGNSATWKTVYVVCTTYVSGTASVQLGLSAASYSVAILNTVSVQDIEQAGYIALTSPPTQTSAGTETVLTFSSQVNRVEIYNGWTGSLNYAFDTTVTLGSNVLPPGYQLDKAKKITAVHILTASAVNINGATAGGIVVLGSL